jgi:tetratricopeptide (TPR) repeat protein
VQGLRVATLSVAVVVCAVAGGATRAQTPPIAADLDGYLSGDFDRVLADVAAKKDFDGLLKDLAHGGTAWVDGGKAADRSRRELAAATFALEAARLASETLEWKWVQSVNLNVPAGTPILSGIPGQSYHPPPAVWWKTPPKLLEWGCALLRREPTPSAAERLWQLAAVATADRAGDFEFLIGSPFEERGNPQDEFEHLNHVIKRFPDEHRFALAQAIALEWRTWPAGSRAFRYSRQSVVSSPDAIGAFDHMSKDEAIGAEASLRLGDLRLRLKRFDDALALFAHVEATTRDPYLVYLAHYFSAQAFEGKQQRAEAERAYRAALATVPRAQSATMALAAILFESDRRAEATALVETSVEPNAPPDPWRGYGAADERFWPELQRRLHSEIVLGDAEARVR